jgi:hypothetical protein
MDTNQANLKNGSIWDESSDGTCNLLEPTLIYMGEDLPLHLMFPVHWREALSILPDAQKMARQQDAFLVLMLSGKASESEIQSLILELAKAQVIPLWVGEDNQRKFDEILAKLSVGNLSNGKSV